MLSLINQNNTLSPSRGKSRGTEDFLFQPGGCAANTAIALAKLGVSVSVSGKVGNDPFGDTVARELQANGVQREAIAEEMRRDPAVFLIGEDIGIKGGFGGA